MKFDIVGTTTEADGTVAPVLRQRPQVDYTRQAQTQFTRLCADSERVTYAARNVGVTTGTAGLTPGMVTVTSTDTVAEHSMGTRRKILDALDAGMPHAAGWCEVSGLDGATITLYLMPQAGAEQFTSPGLWLPDLILAPKTPPPPTAVAPSSAPVAVP